MHNFYSDTQTKPSRAMLEAALTAPLGDEQKGADPTTRALEERVAELLGKEDAVFLPSGTMCNQIALRVHCRPGDEVICERTCHIVNFEGGGGSAIAGIAPRTIDGVNGIYQPEQVAAAIRPANRHAPISRLLAAEQTANMGGGAVWPLETLSGVAKVARDAGLATHMDGARLLNAVVASGTSAAAFAEHYDSVWIDFTKGLGAPVGAALAGSRDFIGEAWRYKQQMGGAMRQSGVIAAMCDWALEHNVERMAEDHHLAQSIAARLIEIPSVSAFLPCDTNILIFELSEDAIPAPELVTRMAEDGITIGALDARRIRVVTHLDVDRDAAEFLLSALARHLS